MMNRENITNSGGGDGDERERPRIQMGAINPENGRLQGYGEELERRWRNRGDIDKNEDEDER